MTPSPEDSNRHIIYHYCNEFVFDSIIQQQKIWLSDIFKMNDSSELSWARELFVKVLKENKELFKQEFRWYVINVVFSVDDSALPLIGCFSENGDLLSQWRAYADDASGLSIGFFAPLIYKGLGVNINKVIYDERIQYVEILENLKSLHEYWLKDGENYENIDPFAKGFAIDLNYYKNPGFFEEREIRIVRLVVKDSGTDSYIDVGGNSEIKEIVPLEVKKRLRKNDEIFYLELPLDIPGYQPIKEVILGPKCRLKPEVVMNRLNEAGIEGVEVKLSSITYR